MRQIPETRVRAINNQPVNPKGQYVLYWMTAYRRTQWNFALQHAIDQAHRRKQGLVIFEALRCDYPFASLRLHRFIVDGMIDNCKALQGQPAIYYPYIEPSKDAGKGLLMALSADSSLVVTDDFPAFFLPKMIHAAGQKLPVRLEAVDSNGLLPLSLTDHAYPTAYAYRRFLQKVLPNHLSQRPAANPFENAELAAPVKLSSRVLAHWEDATPYLSQNRRMNFSGLPIDHQVEPVNFPGGQFAAQKRLDIFLKERLSRYAVERNHPDAGAPSGLSPYLHFGQISSHEIFSSIAKREDWSPYRLGPECKGKRTGWWGLSANAEAFLDQLITWRELGFNMCHHEPVLHKKYEGLPEWARKSLEEHRGDPRPHCYTFEELRDAKTHDALWNAAQCQLRTDGFIHNYLRMLWGKKILEWSPTPQEALEVMIELNDRYAIDGRDPNSYSGISWCLGRYDRPWGPVRPIFGTVRYMSSENTKRKVKVNDYLARYAT